MTKPRALVVDDEPDIRELLGITLERMNLDVTTADTIGAATRELRAGAFDLCLTDMRLPDGDGLDIVEWIQTHKPQTPVAVITAHGNVETAVRALKLGAFDFISKPLDVAALRKLIAATLKLGGSAESTLQLPQIKLLGRSRAMEQLREMIERVARSQAPVHIYGESGTGKELVAHLIHDAGARRDGPFVPVNCGAIPTELMESELFGHKKGSFTGAIADKQGLIQSAEGGTLFLDEIADLPLHMQVKLLRVIQEKSVRPVGESHGNSRSTCASCRPPTGTWRRWSPRASSARTCSTASTSSRSACRRCASGWRTSTSWSSRSWRASGGRSATGRCK